MVSLELSVSRVRKSALGNRSLFADPRGQKMKDKVNSIKQRRSLDRLR